MLIDQAKEFRKKFGCKDKYSNGTLVTQLTLISEERKELESAVFDLANAYSKHIENAIGEQEQKKLLVDATTNLAKEAADLVYVVYQLAAFLNINLDEAMNRVHESNMSKLGEDGCPIYRSDGKVLKGPNYKEPDLKDIAESSIVRTLLSGFDDVSPQ